MLPVSLDSQFLIVPSVLFNVYNQQNTTQKTKDRATRTPLESINKQMDYLARSFQY